MLDFLMIVCLILQVNVYQTIHDSNDIEYIKISDKEVYAEAYNKNKELVDTYKIISTKE